MQCPIIQDMGIVYSNREFLLVPVLSPCTALEHLQGSFVFKNKCWLLQRQKKEKFFLESIPGLQFGQVQNEGSSSANLGAKEQLTKENEEWKQKSGGLEEQKTELEVRMSALKSQYEGRICRLERELREQQERHLEQRDEPTESTSKVRYLWSFNFIDGLQVVMCQAVTPLGWLPLSNLVVLP